MHSIYDLKQSFRRLFRDYEYSAVVIATMALTLGIALFLYTVTYTIQNKPLPNVDEPNNIAWGTLSEGGGSYSIGGLSNYTYDYLKQHQTVLDHFGRLEERMVTLSNSQFTEQFNGVAVSHELFPMLGATAIQGRVLLPSDDVFGAQKSVVISYKLWETIFNRSNEVVGQTIKLDGDVATIVGVMPDGFHFPVNHDLWFTEPLHSSGTADHAGWNSVFGRLKADKRMTDVDAEFARLMTEIGKEYPDQYKGKTIGLMQFTKRFAKRMAFRISMIEIASLAIFLMGCFSVSNLIIVRNLEDAKSVIIKATLGIPMRRIVASLLLDTLAICLIGALLGLWLCFLAIRYFGHNILEGPYWWTLEFQFSTVLLGLAGTLLIWVLTGIISLWIATRQPSNGLLSSGRKGGTGLVFGRIMAGFSTLQIFSSFILMVFTGVLIVGLVRILNADYGVQTDRYLTAQVKLSGQQYANLDVRTQYYQRFMAEALRTGVQGVAVTGALPGRPTYNSTYTSTDRDIVIGGGFPQAFEMPITDNYFEFMGIHLLEGRNFTAADKEGTEEVGIINQSMKDILFPGESAVGRQFKCDPGNGDKLITVVGVVPDVLGENPLWFMSPKSQGMRSQLYRPITQKQPQWAPYTLVFRTEGNPRDLASGIKAIARTIDPEIPLYSVKSYSELVVENGNGFRKLIWTFFPAAFISLVISALGVYSSSRRIVLQATPDIGVMRAIGIEERVINRKYISTSLFQLALGLITGAIFCLLLLPKLPGSILITNSNAILVACGVVSVVFGSLVLLASYIPLIKAHKMSPRDAMNFMGTTDA